MAYDPTSAMIEGLRLSLEPSTQLTIYCDTGVCYLPDNTRLMVTAQIKAVITSPSTATWYHLYLYAASSGVSALEASTTPPANPYVGTARCKDGDLTRRYLGSVYVSAAGKVTPFRHVSVGQTCRVLFIEGLSVSTTTAGGLTMLAAGTSTSVTNVSALTAVPITTSVLMAQVLNASNYDAYLGNPDQPTALSTTSATRTVLARSCVEVNLPLAASGQFNYLLANTNLVSSAVAALFSGSMTIQATGFVYDR